MKLKDKIGLRNNLHELITIGSLSGIGKTTLLSILACELGAEDYDVLFITNENYVRVLKDKCTNYFKLNKVKRNANSNFIINNFENLEDTIMKHFKANKFNIVVVDGVLLQQDIEFLRRVANDYYCTVITSMQLKRTFDAINAIDTVPSKHLHLSDKILILNKKGDITLWESIKYGFCFWLKRPNLIVKIIKNREGEESKFEIHVDFENTVLK